MEEASTCHDTNRSEEEKLADMAQCIVEFQGKRPNQRAGANQFTKNFASVNTNLPDQETDTNDQKKQQRFALLNNLPYSVQN